MEWPEIFQVATCSLGFITLSKALIYFVRWVWIMFLRPPKNLKTYGSWAIVTGSTDGIGKAISLELASKGLNILLVGRNPQKLEATSKEIRDTHGGSVEVKLVVIDFETINGEEIVRKIREATQGLDVGVLVNNVGMASPYPRFFHEDDLEFMEAIIKVNLEAATWVTKAVIEGMIRKKKGAIVNIGSGSCSMIPSYPLCTLYAATKAYFWMFSKCIGLEYKSQGIDVQCQVPMLVATKMVKLKTSLFIPTAKDYSKGCVRWFGYHESLCVPYLLHSLQCLLLRMVPHSLVNWHLMRQHLYMRKRGIAKYSKLKALQESQVNNNN
ncbi:very-long-chain 3-oxoacyl-CoA reductase 1-like [Prosopis cineraria]|uniref:very-long-chain 3-oxoacyl-CoA reductase 1-like n=1 Tax=Prosopis cineraria TaxID=364024 RepID=UPI0024104BE9|nr:very-long-chain 3-oxoacyl-CoA reductase 1-like [Prosopis cineraria]